MWRTKINKYSYWLEIGENNLNALPYNIITYVSLQKVYHSLRKIRQLFLNGFYFKNHMTIHELWKLTNDSVWIFFFNILWSKKFNKLLIKIISRNLTDSKCVFVVLQILWNSSIIIYYDFQRFNTKGIVYILFNVLID